MRLTGVHLLLTYECNLECDHCFVWGSPWQRGTMTLKTIREILQQAKDLGTVEWIYFEGGEPFLYYATLLKGVQVAARLGFPVGIVSNGYWATDAQDALEWLRPFAGLVQDLSISSDLYHWKESLSQQAKHICSAAGKLGIPMQILHIAAPEVADAPSAVGQLPPGTSKVMYRGRAAEQLANKTKSRPWADFNACTHEDLREPGRIHIDPFGNVHICQGIVLGNVFQTPLRSVCRRYDPATHPIVGPLLSGGPAELVRCYKLAHEARYADSCHLCYEARRALRRRLPDVLKPDQMYGVIQ